MPKESPKPAPKPLGPATKATPAKTATSFARTESGRFSMRTPKPATPNSAAKPGKKNGKNVKQNSGGRSNSSLSSREVEFQNWKRRKSYDPMKAAAEVKF